MSVLAGQLGPLGVTTRVASAAFSPADLSPALWVDATAITGLSDSDPVALWEDLGGTGPDLVQPGPTNPPIYKTGIQNGLPVVRFSGSHGLTVSPSPFTMTQPFVFALMVSAVVPGLIGFLIDGAPIRGYIYRTAGSPQWVVGNNGERYNGVGVTGDAAVLVFVVNGSSTNTQIWHNGTRIDSVGTMNASTQFDITQFGRRASSASTFFQGDIGEMVFLPNSADADKRQSLEGYLAHKWGTAGSLPGDHPYKTEAP